MRASKLSPLLFSLLAFGISAFGRSSPAMPASLPSYATAEETIHGRIRSIDGQYRITVRDVKGYLDHVALHRGTLINPPGLALAPRMDVTILGYNAGAVFMANEIDTPYPDARSRFAAGSDGEPYTGPIAGFTRSQSNPLMIFNSPSYPVYVSSGYPSFGYPSYGSYGLGPFGYGSRSWGYPMYGAFGYGWPFAGFAVSSPRGYPWSFVNHPIYGPSYWPYH